jgi:hypothetical protein
MVLAVVATTLVGADGAGASLMEKLPVFTDAPQASVTWQL